jgi:hypothetical protein
MTMRPNLRRQAGSSLIEAVIAVAIFGFLFASGASLLSYGGSRLTQQRLVETRLRLAVTLKRIAGTPASLRSAAIASKSIEPFNDEVRACVNGGDWSIPCRNRNGDGSYNCCEYARCLGTIRFENLRRGHRHSSATNEVYSCGKDLRYRRYRLSTENLSHRGVHRISSGLSTAV